MRDQDGGQRVKRRPGSPAPWSAPAAELLDEILRGALDLNRRGRRMLGWRDLMVSVPAFTLPGHEGPRPASGIGPRPWVPEVRFAAREVPATSTSVETAGRVALRGLPGVVIALQHDQPERRLGQRFGDDGLRGQGYIEEDVRSWHRRALELTGHQVQWERLRSVPNPDHHSHTPGPGGRFAGPACARTSNCRHRSCYRVQQRGKAWLPWFCPSCGSDSLRMDPVSDLVHCMRPACRDEAGEPSMWSAVVFETPAADPWGWDA